MPDNVKLPIAGKMNKKTVFAVGAVVLGVSGYLIFRNYQQKNAAPAGTAGYGYGAYAYGYGAYGYGGYGYGGFFPGGAGFPGYYGYGSGQTGTQITTNQQWSQAVIPALQTAGYSQHTASVAIGRYLQGKSLSGEQVTTVNAAIGLEGLPPVAAASGYPPKYHTTPTSHTVGGTGGGKTHTIRARGDQDLYEIAKANGISEDELIHLNPNLKKYQGTKRKIPKGTRVKV